MKHIDLTIEKQERVGVITLNYGTENQFHPDVVKEMLQTLDQVEKQNEIGALVTTGTNPKFFSTGLDLPWMMQHMSNQERILEYLKAVNQMFHRWTLFPKPTVAALNGHTFAAGLFLAAHMDFRFMRKDRGWVCMPEVDINIPLLPGMIAICQAVMTSQGFRRLYYTGDRLSGPEAKEIGFVEEVYSETELLPKSIEFAAELAKKNTRTYAEMKFRIRKPIAHILEHEDPKWVADTLAFPTLEQ